MSGADNFNWYPVDSARVREIDKQCELSGVLDHVMKHYAGMMNDFECMSMSVDFPGGSGFELKSDIMDTIRKRWPQILFRKTNAFIELLKYGYFIVYRNTTEDDAPFADMIAEAFEYLDEDKLKTFSSFGKYKKTQNKESRIKKTAFTIIPAATVDVEFRYDNDQGKYIYRVLTNFCTMIGNKETTVRTVLTNTRVFALNNDLRKTSSINSPVAKALPYMLSLEEAIGLMLITARRTTFVDQVHTSKTQSGETTTHLASEAAEKEDPEAYMEKLRQIEVQRGFDAQESATLNSLEHTKKPEWTTEDPEWANMMSRFPLLRYVNGAPQPAQFSRPARRMLPDENIATLQTATINPQLETLAMMLQRTIGLVFYYSIETVMNDGSRKVSSTMTDQAEEANFNNFLKPYRALFEEFVEEMLPAVYPDYYTKLCADVRKMAESTKLNDVPNAVDAACDEMFLSCSFVPTPSIYALKEDLYSAYDNGLIDYTAFANLELQRMGVDIKLAQSREDAILQQTEIAERKRQLQGQYEEPNKQPEKKKKKVEKD